MPPKIKVTKEDIILAAVELVRNSGEQAINARTISCSLNCSTQPIFSNFATMDDLRLAVIKKAEVLCQDYMQKEITRGKYPIYKATGMAYIQFAKSEKELFKLLYMRDRSKEAIDETNEQMAQMESIIYKNTGLSGEDAKLFHLEIWAYVHGIATMFATGFLDLDWELVSKMLTDCYQGLLKQYETEQ